VSAAVGVRGGYEGARGWVAQPVNSVLLSLLLVAAFYHMSLGMRVIVEDYIHKTSTKQVLLLANMFLAVVLAAAAVIAVLRISFGS